jgi:hypothetical protein
VRAAILAFLLLAFGAGRAATSCPDPETCGPDPIEDAGADTVQGLGSGPAPAPTSFPPCSIDAGYPCWVDSGAGGGK